MTGIAMFLAFFFLYHTYIQDIIYEERLNQMEEITRQMFQNLEDVLSAAFSSAMEKFAFISERMDNGGGIGIGICLILLAMVVRYGAELEQRGRAK